MTRVAADVQAEIDKLRELSHRNHLASMERVNAARANTDEVMAIVMANVDRINDESRAIQALELEHSRLARAELDAATPPAVRAEALRLRAVYVAAGGHGFSHLSSTWDVLPLDEARAWAAVAREAGHG